MNHCVPDFEMDDDDAIPASSTGLSRVRKSSMPEDEVMELLWQNGPVVMQSQNQRGLKKSPPSKNLIEDAVIPVEQSTSREIRTTSATAPQPEDVSATHLFMQEDEMASWLHYPLEDTSFDRDFCADFLYSAPCATTTVAATTAIPVRIAPLPEPRPLPPPVMAARPPIPPMRMITTEVESSRFSNFLHFSRTKGRAESGPSDSNNNKVVRESTVVDSNETPAMGHESRISQVVRSTGEIGDIGRCGSMSGAAVAGTSSAGGGGGEMVTGDMTVTSSPGGSGASASASAEPVSKPQAENRKRKARQAAAAAADDETEFNSEDVEFESADTKKPVRGSTSAKRSRAAEVHNLSERRRRDRINEKMKALQELIPRCNKSDKASMLDEAIEYLKSLQMQVQMMSMGCSMVPMMFPGVQQYMPPMGMGMGIGMGMGMGMEMGMNRPMMPFPSPLPGSAPAAAAHLGPRYPMPAFHMQPVHAPDPSRIQATNQSDPMLNSVPTQNLNHQQRLPNFADPYQRYIGLHQMQLPSPPQNQGMPQPSTSTPSTSGGAENQNLERRQSG